MPTIELQNPNGGAPARVHFDTMPTDADIDEAVTNLFPKGAAQTPGGTVAAAPPVPSPTMTGNVGSNIAQSAPLASAKGPFDARADDLRRQRVLASLPMPTESHLNEDIARYALGNPANANPPRQTLGQNGPTVATFYHRDGTPFRVVYGGGKPGDPMYGKRLPAGSPDVAKAIGAAHPPDNIATGMSGVGRAIGDSAADAISNVYHGFTAGDDTAPLTADEKRVGQGVVSDAKSLVHGIGSQLLDNRPATKAGIDRDIVTAQNMTGPLKQVAQAAGEAAGGQSGMARKTLGRILPDEAQFALEHPLIAAVNFIPVGHGLASLSKAGAEFATKAGAAGMATLGDKALSDAAAMAKTDPAKATALTNAGYQYHQIAAALRQGKPLGALQIKLGYEGPNLDTGQTISDATGYSGKSARTPAPATEAPTTPYPPKLGANGKPTIKTFKVNTQAPTVAASAFDKPTESAWQEPAATHKVGQRVKVEGKVGTITDVKDGQVSVRFDDGTEAIGAVKASAVTAEPHHSTAQPRDTAGQFANPKNVAELSPVLQRTFGLSTEEADNVAQVYDARARTWAAENNKPVADWYANKYYTQGWGMPESASSSSQLYQGASPGTPDELGFYSHAERVVSQKMGGRASADQIRGMLQSNGVKPEEMKWSGLDDYLNENAGKPITKQDALDHLAGNRVEMNEVVKGTGKANKIVSQGDIDAAERRGDWNEYDRLTLAYEDQQLGNNGNATGNETKYGQYQIPGGSNYREMLLTLPNREAGVPDTKALADYKAEWDTAASNYPASAGPARDAADANLDRIRRQMVAESDARNPISTYRSSHWDEPNVLAHVRMSDRTGPNGEKILHVEEMQSDWHQEGRKSGYRQNVPDGKYLVLDANDKLVGTTDSTDTARDLATHHNGSWIERESRDGRMAIEDANDGVPAAPFSKTWHEMASKRILNYAAKNGYDKVAWTPGDIQNDRYSLHHQVDELTWFPKADGMSGDLQAFKDGKEVVYKSDIQTSSLPDVVGKEVADKIVNSPSRTMSNGKGGVNHILTGQDLKVGGEGMKGFYDKILPDTFSKLGKRFGAKVGTTEVRVGPIGQPGGTALHSIDITPEMRKALTTEGQPLYQGRSGNAKAAVDFTRDGKTIIRALKQPNVSSALHELGHIIRRDLLPSELKTVEHHYGVQDGAWKRVHEERFARQFERYLRDGNAPTAKLAPVFAKIKQWMRDIYQRVKGTPLEGAVHPNVKGVFDRALGKGREGEDVAATETAEKPLTQTAPAPTAVGEYRSTPQVAPDRVNGINLDRRNVEPEVKETLRASAEAAGKITRNTHDAIVNTARNIGLQNSHLVDPSELSVDKPYPFPEGKSPEAHLTAVRELDSHNAVAVKRAEIDYRDNPTKANADKLDAVNRDLYKTTKHSQFLASMSGGLQNAHKIGASPFRAFVTADNLFTPHGTPPAVTSKSFGASNKLFTSDRAADALKALNGDTRLFQSDPAVEYGGYLLEGGYRNKASWSKQMAKDTKLTPAQIDATWKKLRPEAQKRADQLNSPKEVVRTLLMSAIDDPKQAAQLGKDFADVKENPDGSLPPKEARKLAELVSKHVQNAKLETFKHGLRAAMLSGPGTLKKIALLHMLGAAFEENAVRPLATAHSIARSALFGAERTTSMNPLDTGRSVVAGAKAFPGAVDTLLHGETQRVIRGLSPLHKPGEPLRAEFNLGLNKVADKVNNPAGKAALNATNAAVNSVVRLPMRSHGALYHMIGSALYHRGLLEAATLQAMKDIKAGTTDLKVGARVNELMRHPTPEMMDHAHAFYSEQMYQNSNAAANIIRGIPDTVARHAPEASLPAVKSVVGGVVNYEAPFATVPSNVAGRAIESTPLGAINYVKHLLGGKKLTPGEMANMDRVFGRMVAGTAGTVLGYHFLKGMMTPPNSDHGQFSPTLKVPKGSPVFGGRTVDTGEVSPVMNGLNFMVAHKGNSPAWDQLEALVGRTPYSGSLDELNQIREGKGNYANRLIAGELGKGIPALARQSAAEYDQAHSVRSKHTVGDYLANAIPGPPTKINGQAITREALPLMKTPGGANVEEGGGYSALRNVKTSPPKPMDVMIQRYYGLLDKAQDTTLAPQVRAMYYRAASKMRHEVPAMDMQLKGNAMRKYLATRPK